MTTVDMKVSYPNAKSVTPQVTLLSHTPDPFKALYIAYRTSYSTLTPQEMAERVEGERVESEEIHRFVERRMAVGHTSPLEQVWFEFAITGVSRAFSHQFVRHRVGVSFEQQSQRYVRYEDGYPYVVPKSLEGEAKVVFEQYMDILAMVYKTFLKQGVPAEDARYVLPNAVATNIKITINLQALLHMADIRLCTRTQWEFRKVVALMRAEVKRVAPELAKHLQPKCGERRVGYCDEEYKDYLACPISKVRPHRDDLSIVDPMMTKSDDLDDGAWSAIEGDI